MMMSNKSADFKEALVQLSVMYKVNPQHQKFKNWSARISILVADTFGIGSHEHEAFCKLQLAFKIFEEQNLSVPKRLKNGYEAHLRKCAYLLKQFSLSLDVKVIEEDTELLKTNMSTTEPQPGRKAGTAGKRNFFFESFEVEEDKPATKAAPAPAPKQRKVFISHSSLDTQIVDELLDILKLIGLRQDQIFCSSIKGYGIPLGEHLFERLKAELNEDIAVIFVLSENFYNSPICLAEMGAAWVLSKDHAPLIVPPFDFGQVRGVLKNTIGITINDKHDINGLSDWVEKEFGITNASGRDWERSRDKILGRITGHINAEIAAKESKLQAIADENGKTMRQLKDIITTAVLHVGVGIG
jgi:hypothetical protein